MSISCPFCDRTNFACQRALTQHQQRNEKCYARLCESVGADSGYTTAHESFSCAKTNAGFNDHDLAALATNMFHRSSRLGAMQVHFDKLQRKVLHNLGGYQTAREVESDADNEQSDDDGAMFLGDNDNEAVEEQPAVYIKPDETIRANFTYYCEFAEELVEFPPDKEAAIKLMHTLRQTKASLDTYNTIMEWHLKSNGDIHPHESLGSTKQYLSRDKLFKELRIRYNMTEGINNVSQIVLPSSKAKVNIVWSQAHMVIQSMLTDPRIRVNDYLFFDNNPLASPPSSSDATVIGDLNTGLAYLKTYQKLITKPGKQVLLPTPLYIDGAATGQFADLSITAVKISLGIFNRKARDKWYMWRNLGYIPGVTQHKSRGKRLLIESNHMESVRAEYELHQNEGQLDGNEAHVSQDLHTMLDKVLASYVELQKTGFMWDLFYNGKPYKDIEFIPFVPFIKCDTEEADTLCGKYRSRGRTVAHLCRYCHCPTDESDDPLAHYQRKTVTKIQRLIDKKDYNGLKNISQHLLNNACYKLRFGQHDDTGVHGGTPLEMLHALLLGIFRYIRDEFFYQVGDSKQLPDIESLASEIGALLSRQSSRNKPKTKFGTGIKMGKKTAKEFTGILLLLLLVFRSEKGKQLLLKLQKKKGATEKKFTPTNITDWTMMLETMLEWEEWLKSDEMKKVHVMRSKQKHRYIMYLIKKVMTRSTGMGLKITKFHCIMHIADDIMNFGVPMEVDTGSNESGHKPTKTAAKLTQRNKATFDIQTAKRLDETHLLDLAMEEMKGRPVWDYYHGYEYTVPILGPKVDAPPTIGGAQYRISEQNGEYYCVTVGQIGGMSNAFMLEDAFMEFVVGLKNAVAQHIDEVLVHGLHERNGQKFRSSPSYRGKLWRDWAMVDWADYGVLPNKLWGFVDLAALPAKSGINYGGLDNLAPGIYAIVENGSWRGEEYDSELVREILLDCELNPDGSVRDLTFFLADVEAFVSPAMVVPNIGGPNNSYFLVKERDEWRELFEDWLESPHTEDVFSDVEESDEEEDEEELDDEKPDSDNEGSERGSAAKNSDDESQIDDEEGESSGDDQSVATTTS